MDPGGGAVVRPADDEVLRVLLSADGSDSTLGVVDMAFAPRSAGPPLHVHPTHGEGFYVLAGVLTVQIDDEVVSGGPGTWVFAPRDVPHTLANLGAEPARVLCVFAPAGFERRFERMLAAADGATDASAEPSGMTRVVGPPLSPDTP